jgi:hypothetical protein
MGVGRFRPAAKKRRRARLFKQARILAIVAALHMAPRSLLTLVRPSTTIRERSLKDSRLQEKIVAA